MAIPILGRSVDEKHLVIEASAKSGTLCHNYKETFSIVLLAKCGAKYNFTLVDVCHISSNNGSEVLSQWKRSSAFKNNTLNFPERKTLPGINLDMSYFLVGDEIFPLKFWLLCPYQGRLPEMIYKYRHSRHPEGLLEMHSEFQELVG